MKKVILILVLLLSTLQPVNTSAASASHEQLSEYSGYAEALYESVLREKAYLGGQYSNNKEYVEQTVDELISSGKSFFNEMISIERPTDIIEKIIAGGMTAGEWVKQLFDKFNQQEEAKNNSIIDDGNNSGGLERFFISLGDLKVGTDGAYRVTFNGNHLPAGYSYNLVYQETRHISFTSQCPQNDPSKLVGYVVFTGDADSPKIFCNADEGKRNFEAVLSRVNDTQTSYERVKVILSAIRSFGMGVFDVTQITDNSPIEIPSIKPSVNNFKEINNFVKNDVIPSRIKPLSANLVCPDGTRISIKHDGSTFIDKNGQIMQVDLDGTATVDSSICTLEWNKPNIFYDPDGKVTIEQDGVTTDLETGEDIDFDDEIEDGCGVVCAIGKMLTGLGQIAKSIAGLATKILDGLLGLFVPDNLDFVSEEFDKMSAKFTDKFSLLTGLKDTITGVFKSGDSSNPLSEVNLSLPAAPDQNFSLDTVSFIEPFVPRVRQIISGILFLMTIIYVYRKITGRGGVMEK